MIPPIPTTSPIPKWEEIDHISQWDNMPSFVPPVVKGWMFVMQFGDKPISGSILEYADGYCTYDYGSIIMHETVLSGTAISKDEAFRKVNMAHAKHICGEYSGVIG